jgi:hypothetical protein
MITTKDTHEVRPFSFMPHSVFKTWRTAGLDVSKTYFLMSYACKVDRTWINQAMVLWCEQDLLGFCEQACESPSLEIHQITKLVPPEPGQAEMWKAVAIDEIWHCEDESENDDLTFISHGLSHTSRAGRLDNSKRGGMKKIFEATHQSDVIPQTI